MALEGHFGEVNVEDQNLSLVSEKGSKQRSTKAVCEDPVALVPPEKGGKRKRGRPGRGRGSKKAKIAGNQTQRARARIGKRPAKISEYETDESSSHDEKPCEDEIGLREVSLDSYKKPLETQETEKSGEVPQTEILLYSEPSRRDDVVKQVASKEVEHVEQSVPEIEMTERHDDQNSNTEKLEIMADPIQAMLFDMIPGLATKKVDETRNYNVENEKPPEHSNAEPSKKKKVSYKDVASELLKDW